MTDSRRILFIINPISGLGLGKEVPEHIKKLPEYEHVVYDIEFTEYSGHARCLVWEWYRFCCGFFR